MKDESSRKYESRARCPRCGYDLRGTVGTWEDSCPINGTCAECGLVFDWVDLLNPRFRAPRWLIESTIGMGRVIQTFVMSALVSLAPWYFFSSLRLHHEPRWGRIGIYLALLVMMMHLTFAGSNAFVAHRFWGAIGSIDPGVVMLDSQLETTVWAWVDPYRSTARFQHQWPRVSGGRVFSRPNASWFRRLGRHQSDLALMAGLFTLALPAAFLMLPVSRRRAKVRWRHIGRITAYSLLFPVLLLGAVVLMAMQSYTAQKFASSYPGPQYVDRARMLAILAMLMLALWWWFAIRRYLKMVDPGKIGLSVLATAFMVSLVGTYFFYPESASRVISRILFPFGA